MSFNNRLVRRVGIAHPTVESNSKCGDVTGTVFTGKCYLHSASGSSKGNFTGTVALAVSDRRVRVIPVTPRLYRLVCESSWFGR